MRPSSLEHGLQIETGVATFLSLGLNLGCLVHQDHPQRMHQQLLND